MFGLKARAASAVIHPMMKRLKYVSRQAQPMNRSEIEAMVAAASYANAARGITGALIVTGHVFFQILEGPTAEVDALFAKIKADPRHTDVVCLAEQDAREIRFFPYWGMRRIALEETPAAITMKTLVHQLSSTEGPEREALSAELARLMRGELRAAA